MIPLFKPYMPETPGLAAILHSGRLSYGTHSQAFEKSLAKTIGSENILAVSGFNSAVTIALLTLGIGKGDEIIASPMSCLASTQPLLSTGAKVVWADVDPSLGTLCPDSVKARISPRTKLILQNHFCSIIGHADEITAIGRAKGIPVAEDVLEGFMGEYNGRPVGSLCDLSIISFSYVRLPQALEAAALYFADNALLEKARMHRDLGINREAFRLPDGEINPICDISINGLNAAINEIQGYIGCQSMADITKLTAKQRSNAAAWDVGTRLKPITNSKANFCYWVYPVLAEDKKAAMDYFKKQGYQASGVHISNHRYTVFGKQGEPQGALEFESKFFALPCGWWEDI